MSEAYLGDSESLKDLENRMDSPDRELYQSFKHMKVNSAFYGRIYVVYSPSGLNSDGTHRTPRIHGQVKITDFNCKIRTGCEIEFEDMATGETMLVRHIPRRLFNYDVFVAAPPFSRLRFDARRDGDVIRRSLAFGCLIKQRTRSDFYSSGATMADTPNDFERLYPQESLPLQYI